eukprot:13625492-Alexandrium_andersonii.AAC.1
MPVTAATRLSPQSVARGIQNRPSPAAPTAEGAQIAPARPPASTGVQKSSPECGTAQGTQSAIRNLPKARQCCNPPLSANRRA